MREKMMVGLLAALALCSAPIGGARAQDLGDTLGRVLEGLQGPDQRRSPSPGAGDNYRERDRRDYRDQGRGDYRERDRRYSDEGRRYREDERRGPDRRLSRDDDYGSGRSDRRLDRDRR